MKGAISAMAAIVSIRAERLLADQPLEGCNARLIRLEKIGGSGILVECAGLILFDPDPDQVARDRWSGPLAPDEVRPLN